MAYTVAGDRVGENRLLNRELSSLDFYARVLELAADSERPPPRARPLLLDLLARTSTSSSWCGSAV